MGKSASPGRSAHGKAKQERLAKALARGLRVRKKMATEEGGSISAAEVAQRLGMTEQSVLKLYRQGRLLGWKAEDSLRFPAWQFVRKQYLHGLQVIMKKLNAGNALDDWGKVGFFLQSHGLLDEQRPLDLLRKKKLKPVLKAAEAYGS